MKNSRPLYWHLELKVWSRAFSKLVDTSLCFQRRHQWFKSRESISYRIPFWFGQGKEIFWYWLILVYRFRITIYNSNCYHFFYFFIIQAKIPKIYSVQLIQASTTQYYLVHFRGVPVPI